MTLLEVRGMSQEQDQAQSPAPEVPTSIAKWQVAAGDARVSELRFRALFDCSEEGIVLHARDGRIVGANPAAERILGRSCAQLLESSSAAEEWNAVDEDGTPISGSEHPTVVTVRTGKPVRGFVMGIAVPGSAERQWLMVSSALIGTAETPDDGVVFASFIDITERKRAENEIREQKLLIEQSLESVLEAEWKFRALFEKGPLAVAYHRMIYDAAGKPCDYEFLDANEKYIELTGIDPRGKTVLQAFPGIELDPFDWIGTFGHVASSGETIRFEQYLEPNQRWYDCVGYQYRPDHFVAAFIEITERKKLELRQKQIEADLAQSRKMDAIGQLAGGIAHDFNNMLAGILGAADLLDFRETLDDDARQQVHTIIRAAERAAELTSKLLAFSRRTALQLAPIDVGNVLADAITLLSRTVDRKCVIELHRQAKLAVVNADASLLQNAFINLGVNAAHAMPGGGTLTFTVTDVTLDQAYCSNSRFDLKPGPHVEIEIRDTGCGIPPENLARIFEPFFTTKEQGRGTGLGLAAVYGAIQDMHGAISVYSEVGTGTVFHLCLPLSDQVAVQQEPQLEPVRGNGTILIVDDEEFVRVTAQSMLEQLGYQTMTADNGAVAVELLAQNPGCIALVILDMIMPVMSGREAFARLRQLEPNLPIVISSGFSKDEELQQLRQQGLSGFIRKPYRMSALSSLLADILVPKAKQPAGS